MRLVEVAMFLLPFGLFAGWRLLFPASGPSLRLIVAFLCVVALMAAVLFWLRSREAAPPESTYVPSRLQDGTIAPAHPEIR